MGKKGKNQFGFEECSPLFKCELCLAFDRLSLNRPTYPKGNNPNLKPYSGEPMRFKTVKELRAYLDDLT